MRRTRKHIKEGGGGSTDSEDPTVAGIKETSKKKRRKGQTNQKESKGKAAGNKKEGQDRKGSEVSQRPALTEKCQSQALSAKQEQIATTSIAALQTEQSQSNKTSKVLGEHCLFHFCRRRQKSCTSQMETQMTLSTSAYGFSIQYSLQGKKMGKNKSVSF